MLKKIDVKRNNGLAFGLFILPSLVRGVVGNLCNAELGHRKQQVKEWEEYNNRCNCNYYCVFFRERHIYSSNATQN